MVEHNVLCTEKIDILTLCQWSLGYMVEHNVLCTEKIDILTLYQ